MLRYCREMSVARGCRGMTWNGCRPGWNDDCGRWMPIGNGAVSSLAITRAVWAYCPHLNSIERLWGLMHRHITHNKCYATFREVSAQPG